MTSKRYLGNIITPTPTEPAGNLAVSSASGTWSLAEAFAYQKAGLWPIPGNFPLDITDVFSTYLYTGNGSTQTITNDIDLAGEGGLTWIRNRGPNAANHAFYDTERGVRNFLMSNSTNAQDTASAGSGLTAFNSNGFTLGTSWLDENNNGQDVASWTFRKAPKFFDVVTYTGDGLTGRSISHNLGCTPGFIAIKATSSVSGSSGDGSWLCCARKSDGSYAVGDGTSSTSAYGFGFNKTTESYGTTSSSNAATHITDSAFSIQYVTGDGSGTQFLGNTSGATYVAYLFAHNDGDGEFGPNADQDIIKCGSYTTDGSEEATIDLGWEPQWVLFKRTDSSTGGDWNLFDTMRGLTADTSGDGAKLLEPNTSDAELATSRIAVTPTGFKVDNYGASREYIYIAIRRGPLAPPESGTEVFDVDAQAGGSFVTTNFPVDMQINRNRTFASGAVAISRLTGGRALDTSSTGAEGGASYFEFDHQNGIEDNYQGIDGCIYWSFKRAPSFFDVVAYTGNGTAGRTVSHNLGVAPELVIVKSRSSVVNWAVQHKDINTAGGEALVLNGSGSPITSSNIWNATAATESVFSVGTSLWVNGLNETYIAYLFATLPGVSKVGSYTGNGSSQTIDCGFTSGARFILIKRTDSTGDWYVWDTERGIVAGNDPHLSLNTTAAEVTSDDSIDPDNSGFIVNQVSATNINVSSAEYIFYAVA